MTPLLAAWRAEKFSACVSWRARACSQEGEMTPSKVIYTALGDANRHCGEEACKGAATRRLSIQTRQLATSPCRRGRAAAVCWAHSSPGSCLVWPRTHLSESACEVDEARSWSGGVWSLTSRGRVIRASLVQLVEAPCCCVPELYAYAVRASRSSCPSCHLAGPHHWPLPYCAPFSLPLAVCHIRPRPDSPA